MDLSILLKNKKLYREVDITGSLEVNAMGVCLREKDVSIEPFGFAMDVLGSTRRPTTANNLAVTIFQLIMNPSFVPLGMFALVVSYLFDA